MTEILSPNPSPNPERRPVWMQELLDESEQRVFRCQAIVVRAQRLRQVLTPAQALRFAQDAQWLKVAAETLRMGAEPRMAAAAEQWAAELMRHAVQTENAIPNWRPANQ